MASPRSEKPYKPICLPCTVDKQEVKTGKFATVMADSQDRNVNEASSGPNTSIHNTKFN